MGWLHRRSAVAARIGWMLAVSRDFLGKFDAATRRLRLDGGGSPLRTVLCPGFPGIRENYGESFLRIELLADKKPRKSFCFPTFATAASVTRAQIGAENLKFGIREAIRPEQGKSRWSGNRLRRMMPQTHAPSGNDKRRIPYLHVGSDVPLSDLG